MVPGNLLPRTITWMNHGSLTNKPQRAEKAPKIALKSFESQILRISPLFHRITMRPHGITRPKPLILLEGTQGVGYYVRVNRT